VLPVVYPHREQDRAPNWFDNSGLLFSNPRYG